MQLGNSSRCGHFPSLPAASGTAPSWLICCTLLTFSTALMETGSWERSKERGWGWRSGRSAGRRLLRRSVQAALPYCMGRRSQWEINVAGWRVSKWFSQRAQMASSWGRFAMGACCHSVSWLCGACSISDDSSHGGVRRLRAVARWQGVPPALRAHLSEGRR